MDARQAQSSTRSRFGRLVLIAAGTAALVLPAPALADPPTPTYSKVLRDCVTGNNQFWDGVDGYSWYVNQSTTSDSADGTLGCDNYDADIYERPTDPNMETRTITQKPSGSPAGYSPPAPAPTNPVDLSGFAVDGEHTSGTVFATKAAKYFEYADIVNGRLGTVDVDPSNGWMFFQIELFGVDQVDSTLKSEDKFAEGAYYSIRLGNGIGTFAPRNGIMLRNQREQNITTSWSTDAKVFRDTSNAILDAANTVGGQGGLDISKSEGDTPGNGYDTDDQNTGSWLYVRRGSVVDGLVTRPTIDFAFNYKTYNAAKSTNFTPSNLTYIDFDSTRGSKDNQNYLWNDETTEAEQGSPYGPSKPTGNIYELDTLRLGSFPQTGSIRIIKDADPNSAQDFEFDVTSSPSGATIPSSFQLDDDGSTDDADAPGTAGDDDQLTNDRTYASQPTGTYTITEDAVPGWELDSLVCTDSATGGTASTTNGSTATIRLDANETVTCTYQNDQQGSIRIIKDADPNSAQDFEFDVTSSPSGATIPSSFQLDDDGSADDTDAPGTAGDDDQLTNDRTYSNQPVGSYTITEDSVSGWELDSLSCTDGTQGGTASTTQGSTATVNLDPGETVTCTFQNDQLGSIRIVKDADPNSAQDFEFDVTSQPTGGTVPSSFQLDDDGSADDTDAPGTANDDDQLTNDRTYANQPSGTYTITEDSVAGWELDDLTCVDGNQNGTPSSDQGSTATIELDPGETVTCTFQNDQLGSIRIVKDADPNSAQDFEFDVTSQPTGGTVPSSFQLDDDGSTDDTDAPGTANDDDQLTNDRTYSNQPSGTYTITEDAVSGWELDDLNCVDGRQGGSASSDQGSTATIQLDPGETVTCTFQNDQLGSIRIVKDADPNSAQDFEFDVTSAPTGSTVPSSFQLDDDGSTDDTDAPGTAGDDDQLTNDRTYSNQPSGTYTITEDAVSGWRLDDLTCVDGRQGGTASSDQGSTATIQLDPGETVTCTFQNDQLGSIRIIKDADPDSAQDFEFDVTSSPSGATIPSSFQLDDNGNTDDSDAPGTAGDDDQLTNDRTYANQPSGTYTITEDAVSGWELDDLNCVDGKQGGTASSDQGSTATIQLDPGETVTCTYQNDQLGSIRIVKDADPNSAQDFEFDVTSQPTGGSVPSSFQLDDDGSADDTDAPGTANDDDQLTNDRTYANQPSGTYTITEDAVSGWQLDDLTCVDGKQGGTASSDQGSTATIQLDPGETVTCTFQNDQLGSIRIVKDADPNSAQDFEFDVTSQPTGGSVPSSFQLDDDGSADDTDAPGTANDDDQLTNDRTYANQPDGTYTISEDTVSGWDLDDLSCVDSRQGGTASSDQGSTATIQLDPGETVTCTFQNDQRGSVRVVKDAAPDSPQDFAFTTTSSTSTALPADFQLDDDGNTNDADAPGGAGDDDQLTNDRTYGNLKPGTYTVTETGETGWDLDDLACVDSNQQGTASSDQGSTGTIELDPGETVTCTFENVQRGSVRIVKDADPDSAQDFAFDTTSSTSTALPTSFQLDDDGSSDDTDAPGTAGDDDQLTNDRTYGDLKPGTYTVAEADTTGWDLTGIECADSDAGGTASSDQGSTATIQLDPGETVTCTFTNVQEAEQQSAPVRVEAPSSSPTTGQAPLRQRTPGAARLVGPSRCVRGPFLITIRGREIASVTMFAGGKRIRTLRAGQARVLKFTTKRVLVDGKVRTVKLAQAQQEFRFRIDPRGLKQGGLHRIEARVRFTTESGTATRTLRFRYRRCAAAQRPVFTG